MHLCCPSPPSSLACPPPPQPWPPSPCQPLPSTSAFVFASLAALSLTSTSAQAVVAIAQTLLTTDGSRNRPDRQARRRQSPGETARHRRTALAARRGPLHNHRRLLLLLPWLGRHEHLGRRNVAEAHGETRTSSAMESASIWISSGRRPRGRSLITETALARASSTTESASIWISSVRRPAGARIACGAARRAPSPSGDASARRPPLLSKPPAAMDGDGGGPVACEWGGRRWRGSRGGAAACTWGGGRWERRGGAAAADGKFDGIGMGLRRPRSSRGIHGRIWARRAPMDEERRGPGKR